MPDTAAQRATEVDGHWQVVLDIDQVTPVPLPFEVVQEFTGELLDFLADRLRTTGGTTIRWVPDAGRNYFDVVRSLTRDPEILAAVAKAERALTAVADGLVRDDQ